MSETMIAKSAPETSEQVEVKSLTALDRCDRCSAAALYQCTKPGAASILMFCGHHTRKHEPALVGDGWTIHGDKNALSLAEARRE